MTWTCPRAAAAPTGHESAREGLGEAVARPAPPATRSCTTRAPRARAHGHARARQPQSRRAERRDAHALHDADRVEARRPTARSAPSTGSAATSRAPRSSRNGSSASSTLTLKIPSDKLDDGLAQLSKLAHVKSRSQQDQDVTDQREALEAAVRDARADRAGLRVRLAKATTDQERSRLRAQLDRATRRVTRRQREVAELTNAVSFATVELGDRGRPPLRRGRASRRPLDARRRAGRRRARARGRRRRAR